MEKKTKIKKIFIDNIWIIGNYQGKEIIGRTKQIENLKLVYSVNHLGTFNVIKFDDISNICKLNIINDEKDNKTKIDIKFVNNKKLVEKVIEYQNKYN